MRLLTLTFTCVFLGFTILNAQQSPVQTLRGTVSDAVSGQPLIGATLQLAGIEEGRTTNEQGAFRWEELPVGRYQLEVRYLGYQNLLLPEVLLESGKEVVLNLQLQPGATTMETVEVSMPQAGTDIVPPLNVKTISAEQVQRFPATYYDPARVATSFAGVVNANDQSNALSIRGHSPDHLSWQLEGLPILNPNHTPNAGTTTDRMTLNSGGVNILSAQMLSTTRLLTGAFPASYGNALSGIMDMSFRTGNREQHEFTAQAGLIGLDVAAEGPFSKKGGASFLANYRYSTVGLLTQLGVDFGEEAINFQDLSFKFSFPGKKGQELTVFGLGGISSNTFDGKTDPAEWETERDLFNVDFESAMGAAGVSWKQPVGENGLLYAVAGASVVDQQREQSLVTDTLDFQFTDDFFWDANTLELYSAHAYYQQHLSSSKIRLRVGVQANAYRFKPDNSKIEGSRDTLEYALLRPYASVFARLTDRLSAQLGLNVSFYDQKKNTYLEPRASLSYQLSEKHQLSAAYGLHSQYLSPYQLFLPTRYEPQRAHHISLGYDWQIKPTLQFSTEVFYHRLFNIPTAFNVDGTYYTPFATYNLFRTAVVFASSEKIEGNNMGIELELNQYLANGFYYLLNTTIYESTYVFEEENFSTPFDGSFVANATFGKEWQKQKSGDKIRIWGLNLRAVYAGGFREPPISVESSQLFNRTIYATYIDFSNQLPDVFRADFRVYLKRSRPNYSTTLALDLQNLTNQENVAFNYYDILNQKIDQRNQISLVPILTYRVEF